MFNTRLHSAIICDVVAGSALILSLTSFVPMVCYTKYVHERRVITHNRAGKTHSSRFYCDLTTMRLEVGVALELARADPCAVDHEVEFCIHIFELFEMDVGVDFAAGLQESARRGNRDKS